MTKLSVIIPVYNREKTIKQAIDSVIGQLNENIELVIVNDGSTDGTKEVIKDYLINYKENISYYEKENEGIGQTRNFGIIHAKGKYIMFVDSDDYIDKNLISNVQPYLEEDIDIVKFKLTCVNSKNEEIYKIDGPCFDRFDGQEAFNKLAFMDKLIDSPCVYVFKKELFVYNELFFKEGTYHEDFGLIPLVLLMAKSVVSTDIYGYYYVQTKNSITRNSDYSKTIKRFEDSLLHYDNMLEVIKKFEINKKTQENVKMYYTNAILLKLKSIKKEDRKQYIKQIRNRRMIRNIKVKGIRQVFKILILSININWYLKLIK